MDLVAIYTFPNTNDENCFMINMRELIWVFRPEQVIEYNAV